MCYTRVHTVLPATKNKPHLFLLQSHRVPPFIRYLLRLPTDGRPGWVDLGIQESSYQCNCTTMVYITRSLSLALIARLKARCLAIDRSASIPVKNAAKCWVINAEVLIVLRRWILDAVLVCDWRADEMTDNSLVTQSGFVSNWSSSSESGKPLACKLESKFTHGCTCHILTRVVQSLDRI